MTCIPSIKPIAPPPPPDLVAQIEPLHEIIRALGVPLLLIDKVEADDVIATLAIRAANAGMKILISTGDKDLAQIVDDNTHLINTMNNTRYDRAGVIKKYGVPPERIVDYLTLIGDTSDNVPGIPKVGPKTAVKWLSEYSSLDEIVANAGSFTGKVGEYLRENLDQIPLSKQLVTLKTDLHLPLSPEQLYTTEHDKVKLKEHYQRWGFRSWLPEINGQVSVPSDVTVQVEKQGPSVTLFLVLIKARGSSLNPRKIQGARRPDRTVTDRNRKIKKYSNKIMKRFIALSS